MDTNQFLRDGIIAAKTGRRDEARQLLIQVVKIEPRNEQAWLWLSGVVDDPLQKQTCLEYVLKINPHNPHAQQGLATIQSQRSSAASAHNVTQQANPSLTHATEIARPTRQVPSPHTVEQSRPPETTRPTRQVPSPPTIEQSCLPETSRPALNVKPASLDLQQERVQKTANETEDIRQCCPYCGVFNNPEQRTCRSCSKSFIIRADPPENPSVALSFLGGLWGIGSIFLIGANFIWISQSIKYAFPMVVGFLSLGLAVALLHRYRWAYVTITIATIILFVLSIFAHFWLLMLPFFLWIPRSYRDFFGRKERFVPFVPQREHKDHHRVALKYKEKGMMFMAIKEWEAALAQEPNHFLYLQMLGFAYAKLNQSDQALGVLRRAHSLRPDDTQIQKIIAILEEERS